MTYKNYLKKKKKYKNPTTLKIYNFNTGLNHYHLSTWMTALDSTAFFFFSSVCINPPFTLRTAARTISLRQWWLMLTPSLRTLQQPAILNRVIILMMACTVLYPGISVKTFLIITVIKERYYSTSGWYRSFKHTWVYSSILTYLNFPECLLHVN